MWFQANFVFTVKKNFELSGIRKKRQVRIGSIKEHGEILLAQAEVPPMQLKDLRTFFNWFDF